MTNKTITAVPELGPGEIEIPKKVRILKDKTPLYLGDSFEYGAAGTLKANDIVEVAALSVESGWYAVRVPKYILWIEANSCEAVDEEIENDETEEA